MEKYREIAKKLFVPSLLTLILSSSSIIITYSLILKSTFQSYIGLSLAIFSIPIFFMIIKFSNSDGASIDKTVYDNKSTLRKRILFLSLLISFIMPMRIIDITKYSPIDNKCKKFYGIVEQIRVLRYSREVVIRFREVDKRGYQYKNISNMAVCYIYYKMAIKPKDEIIIFKRPDEIRLNREKQTYFESTLLRKGIRYIFYLNEKNCKIAKSASVSFKQRIRNSINNNLSSLFDINTTGVLKALYFGNKNYIDKLTIYEFKRAGALHVLAASGLHVGIISALPLFLLGAFRINRKIILIVISLVVLFYLYITDMPVSLMRAFIMLLVFSVQRFFDMDRNILNTLFLAAIIILLIFPGELYKMGFQLSFGATIGIILFFRIYQGIFRFLPAMLSNSLAVTLSAQIIVLPVILLHMKEVNLTSVVSNIAIVPMMAIILVLSISSNLISLLTFQGGQVVAFITEQGFSFVLYIIKFFSSIDGHFHVENIISLLLLPYSFLIIPLIPLFQNKKITVLSIPAFLLTAWFILYNSQSLYKNQIIVFRNESANAIILKTGKDVVISGDIKRIDDAKTLVEHVKAKGLINIKLCITVADCLNLKSYSYIIKRTIASKCYLSTDFFLTSCLKYFCKTVDADNIDLTIVEFKGSINRKSSAENIRNNDIAFFIKKPIQNIKRIHHYVLDRIQYKSVRELRLPGKKYTMVYL